jgi:hypothetical protein
MLQFLHSGPKKTAQRDTQTHIHLARQRLQRGASRLFTCHPEQADEQHVCGSEDRNKSES